MCTEIRCCRKNAKLTHKNQFETVLRIRPYWEWPLGWQIAFPIISAFTSITMFVLIIRLAVCKGDITCKNYGNRAQFQSCLGENERDCLTYAESDLIFHRVCNAITTDDFTHKAMNTNFDDAILHETLKFNGYLRNSSKHHENRLVL